MVKSQATRESNPTRPGSSHAPDRQPVVATRLPLPLAWLLNYHTPALQSDLAGIQISAVYCSPMPRRSIPHDDFNSLLRPTTDYRRNGDSFHVLRPVPDDLALHSINGQIEVRPLIPVLNSLFYLHPAWCPHPSGLAYQADAHFICPIHLLGPTDAGQMQLLGEPPFFQAACSTAEALGDLGRGTFFFNPRRAKTQRMPQ